MGDRSLQNFDWLILLSALLLMGIGLLNLFSVGHVPAEMSEMFEDGNMRFFQRQALWAGIGLGVMIFAWLIPFRYYEGGAVIFYIAILMMLILVLLTGASKGSSRWIVMGAFRFQPSEVMKVALIFLLARFLAEKRHDPNRLRILMAATAMTLVPFLFVVRQPDLGTALVYPALLLPILYWRGLDEGVTILIISPVISAFLTIYSQIGMQSGRYPFLLLAFFVLLLIIAYKRREKLFQCILLLTVNLSVMLVIPTLIEKLKPYQQRRIFAFLSPESDILGSGWQVYQSKVAVGSGGFLGKGYLRGTQKLLAFLPERHSDFVYSVLSEEAGYIGAISVIFLFSIIIIRGLYLSTKVKSRFASIAIIGICSYFTFHVAVNIGMTIGLAPVTGLPIPFLSYGGSSMLVSCFLIGVLLNFGSNFYEY